MQVLRVLTTAILPEVTALEAMVGLGKDPVRSPPTVGTTTLTHVPGVPVTVQTYHWTPEVSKAKSLPAVQFSEVGAPDTVWKFGLPFISVPPALGLADEAYCAMAGARAIKSKASVFMKILIFSYKGLTMQAKSVRSMHQ
jgi:hypothetical protein